MNLLYKTNKKGDFRTKSPFLFSKIRFQPSASTDPGPARGLKVFAEDPQNGHTQSSGRSLKAVPAGVFVLGSPLSGS
jgi:hypothetical protein